jgi:hypothetical protein
MHMQTRVLTSNLSVAYRKLTAMTRKTNQPKKKKNKTKQNKKPKQKQQQ